MKEYWVNVYKFGKFGTSYASREEAEKVSFDCFSNKTLADYRIHVKLKPVVPKYLVLSSGQWDFKWNRAWHTTAIKSREKTI